jgi:Flp pilus assembly protein TadG
MILSLLKKVYHDNKGSPAVELALIFPVFLLMMVGALDYGSAFVRKMQLTEITKAGIQYAMVKQPTYSEYLAADYVGISSRINTNLGSSGNASTNLNVSYICKCSDVTYDCATGTCPLTDTTTTFIKVRVTEDYETPFFNYSWFGINFPMSAEATIKVNKVSAVSP